MIEPKISLIIPAYNEELYIGPCLDAAIRNSSGKLSEIIVIDNASTDRTAEIANSRKGVRVVREMSKGLTKARQRGLEEAKGDLLAYIDADTRMPEGWIETALKLFSEKPEAVSLSGPYRYYDGSSWLRFVMFILWYIFVPITYQIVGYVLLGGNFIAKKDALLKMGGFDKSIEFYGEDTDIARRLHQFGKVVCRMNFFIYSSSRRLSTEGLIKANFVYAMNYIWQVIFHRPFTGKHQDIRIENN